MYEKSRIGLVLPNRMVASIDLYLDAGAQSTGKILKEHYNSEKKVVQLLKGGNLAAMNSTPANCIYCGSRFDSKMNETPEWPTCRAQVYPNVDAFVASTAAMDAYYLFEKGRWQVVERNRVSQL